MPQSESPRSQSPQSGATSSAAKPVVVAVGNQPVDSALEYAVEQAVREGCGVHLIHVLHPGPTGPEAALLDYAEVDQVGHDLLRAAVERAGDLLAGRATLTSALLRGPVVPTLLEATAGTARAVVMQRRDVSRVIRSVTRSISSGVASHAHVPVVSVPAGWSESAVEHNHGRPVVTVGVDVPERCAPVVATAAAEARSRGGSLHVLHTWWFPSVYDDIITSRVENDAWADRAREEVQKVVAGLGDVVRGVPVEIEARHAHPADALLDAGRESTLLVVGRHDPLVPFGSHLGPVARAVLRDAGCPVLLANPTDSHGNRRRHHHSASDSSEPQSIVMS